MLYIYQHKDWPDFHWDKEIILPLLTKVRHRQGWYLGRMENLGFALQNEAMLHAMTDEIIKSNEIEGEFLNADQVRSSIARQLGIATAGMVNSDRHIDGIVQVMLDATQNYNFPLTEDRLFGWHSALFPTGRSGMYKITVGDWRTRTMEVISGGFGKETVHFEAPKPELVPEEMKLFLHWFNSNQEVDDILKAAIAHLWFVTIHPFSDGNGRTTRTITEMQLARADGIAQRFYSMSTQIRLERTKYYEILESTQKGTLDITNWMEWFLLCLNRSIESAEIILGGVLQKARYWDWFSTKNINERQKSMLNKLLDGFEGKLTTVKWSKITKCSHDTAYRDITNLVEQGIIKKEEGGSKNTSFILVDVNNKKYNHPETLGLGGGVSKKNSNMKNESTHISGEEEIESLESSLEYLTGDDKISVENKISELKEAKASFEKGGLLDKWNTEAHKLLIGKVVRSASFMTEKEAKHMGWDYSNKYKSCLVIEFEDKTVIYPSADDEGNDAGFFESAGEEYQSDKYENLIRGLIGAKIVTVGYEEMYAKIAGWSKVPVGIRFEPKSGLAIHLIVQSDIEGNNGGALFGQTKTGKHFGLPTL